MPENELKKWFLGPTGENAALLQELTRTVVERAARSRNEGDAPLSASRPEDDRLEQRVAQLLDYLQTRTVPAHSSRYQAHMGWDLLLPGVVGHLIGMLFPSNNVAYEGSPGTTVLEMLVARDLCRMLGFPETAEVKPWGHLVGGGTIGNIEALWAARNLKFLPLALKATLRLVDKDQKIRFSLKEPLSLKLGGSDVKFDDLDTWRLLNIPIDQSLSLPASAAELLDGVDRQQFEIALNAQSLNQVGIHHFLSNGIKAPKILLSHDNHYSLEKAVALLGLGQDSLEFVTVDDLGRMNIGELKDKLEEFQRLKVPVLAVVANLGSTELGAVDDLKSIVELRNDFRRGGFEFMLHVDAAFGGYHASLLQNDFDLDWAGNGAAGGSKLHVPRVRCNDTVREIGLSDDVEQRYLVLREADSIAVDPHKLGFMPYPGGGICYRNSALRDLTKFSAPYLGAIVPQGIGQIEERTDQFMGVFGVEGSRSGGSAAAVFLAHSLLRPTKDGYGQLSGRELYASKRVFAALLSLDHEAFKVAVAGKYPQDDQKEALLRISKKDDWALERNELTLLKECGPDLNLLCYLFNFKLGDQWNEDLLWLNVFNVAIYDSLKLKPETGEVEKQSLIVSQTIFAGREGTAFIECMVKRLGMKAQEKATLEGAQLFALRSAEWNPWLTERDPKLTAFKKALSSAAESALPKVIAAKQTYEEEVARMRG
jgi:glutamate/tyrosine decarboxylase-like PLP-dependent enzyme